MSNRDDLMCPSDVARVLGISADTVRILGDEGKLPCFRTVGGRRLFRRGDVDDLAAKRERDRKAAA